MPIEVPSRILVVQARSNVESAQLERTAVREHMRGTRAVPVFINPPAPQAGDPQLGSPRELLRGIDGTFWPGSLDFNLSKKTPQLAAHLEVARPLADEVLDRGIPAFGVCFGHQLLSTAAGGLVERVPGGEEVGRVPLNLTLPGQADVQFEEFPKPTIYMLYNHRDSVVTKPPDAVVMGETDSDPHSALKIGDGVYLFQGHPELTDPNSIRRGIRLSQDTEDPCVQTHDLEAPDQTNLLVVTYFRRVANGDLVAQVAA